MDAAQIATLLASKDLKDRARAVQLCGRLDVKERRPLLLKALNDRANYIATRAASALADCLDLPTAEATIQRFRYVSESGVKRDAGCHVRTELARAYAANEIHGALDVLRIGVNTYQYEPVGGVLFDTGTQLRLASMVALIRLHAPDALEHAALMLYGAPIVQARVEAARAIAVVADPAAHLPLVLRLTFPGVEEGAVLQECMLSLLQTEYPRPASILQPYLGHNDRYLAIYAAIMLARINAPGIVEWIGNNLRNVYGDLAEALLLALISMRTEESDALIDQQRHSGTAETKAALERLSPPGADS